MRICVHLGPHRTATTHFQQMLAAARPGVTAAGGRLLLPRDLRGPRALPLEAAVAGDADAAGRFRQGALPGPKGLLLSEENLLGPALRRDLGPLPYPLAAMRLERLLTAAAWPTPVHLMLAIRPPADWLVSAYSQRLLAGHYLPFAEFAAGIDPRRLGWAGLVGRLRALSGVAGCIWWRFAEYPRLLPAILSQAVPVEAAGLVRASPGRANPGLSAPAVAAVAAAASGKDRAAQRALAAEARARFPVGAASPPFAPFPPQLLAEAAAAHAEDLARLACLEDVACLQVEATARPDPGT